MSARPETLSIWIGGYFGPSYEIKTSGDHLCYSVSGGEYSPPEQETIIPTDKQWRSFARTLDDLGVWAWAAVCENPGICDGTQWHIRIDWGSRSVNCRGDNNYPGAKGRPSGEPGETREFRRLLRAVQRLIGGRPFQ